MSVYCNRDFYDKDFINYIYSDKKRVRECIDDLDIGKSLKQKIKARIDVSWYYKMIKRHGEVPDILNRTLHILYLTIHELNYCDKVYAGRHSTRDLFDRYLGSGSYLSGVASRYSSNSLSQIILAGYDTFDEVNREEEKLVDKVFVGSLDTYNLKLGGNHEYHPNYHGAGRARVQYVGRRKWKLRDKILSGEY